MKQNKICAKCKKEFITYHNCKYCSRYCYWKVRWGGDEKCKACGKKSKYRYCSNKCVKDYWNKNGYRTHAKKWYWSKKMALIKELGNKCSECGEKDIIVLDIDHIDRTKKKMFKNHQYTNNRRLKEWLSDKTNLRLLCANCHRRRTYKQMKYGQI